MLIDVPTTVKAMLSKEKGRAPSSPHTVKIITKIVLSITLDTGHEITFSNVYDPEVSYYQEFTKWFHTSKRRTIKMDSTDGETGLVRDNIKFYRIFLKREEVA